MPNERLSALVLTIALFAPFFAHDAHANTTAGPQVRLTSRGNELARTTGLRHGDFPAALRGGLKPGRPGLRGCGGRQPPDDGLRIDGYASAAFSSLAALVASKVTIYSDSSSTDTLFARLRSTFTARCTAAAAGATGRIVSARVLHPRVPLDHARGFSLVIRRGRAAWSARVYVLGEGRIASTLIVAQRGTRLTGGTVSLALSLLVSRMED